MIMRVIVNDNYNGGDGHDDDFKVMMTTMMIND